MILKCKMCGGDIEFTPGATFGTCEYCGSASTIPKGDDESKLNRYNRANHFRRQCDFDKALAAYEKLLEQDDTDAEAHWGAALSRYGIEYVEDPASGKRIPTCHRVQLTSILADEDYKAALTNAPDADSRRIYEEQANEIARIQKGILAVSAAEKPYDVFICYKETDDQGQRTRDSQWAQEVYYGLTDQGYRVFFSRITLEDKLGQQYEPYIFAALNSAKVMIVIGSKPEHFNAVWVRNEWSRYLALMARDRSRLLIPCYRDMDPYDLPEELSSLQSQDMSKIGFMQDLLRGVKKVLDADKKPAARPTAVKPAETPADPYAPGVTSLMKRARLFMEDGDFKSASEYLDRVLDLDPECSAAYASKTCVALGLRTEDALADCTFMFDDNSDWQKARRFATPEEKARYDGYLDQVRARVDGQIRTWARDCAIQMAVDPKADKDKLAAELSAYRAACSRSAGNRPDGSRRPGAILNEEALMKAVKDNEPGEMTERGLLTAAKMLGNIGNTDTAKEAKQCSALAEQARQKAVYTSALDQRKTAAGRTYVLENAAKKFRSIPDYKDAMAQAEYCTHEAEKIREKLYQAALKEMNEAGGSSTRWQYAIDKLKDAELNGYRDVDALRERAAERYRVCADAEALSNRQAEERARREAEAAAARKKRNTIIGISAFVILIAAVILVTQVIIPGSKYKDAVELQQARRYEEAIAAFEALGSYKDSADQIKECRYLKAKALIAAGEYSEAYTILVGIKGYKDVDDLLKNDQNLVAAAAAALDAKFAVGNTVTFGAYPQTKAGTDMTPVEWLVLARNGKKALLISRYALDCKPYNTSYTSVTWETCTLRKWLNNEFINKAFTAAEQAGILTVTVDNSKAQGNSKWSTSGGNDTQDKVFLLSYAEAGKYFKSDEARKCAPTDFAINNGAWTNSSYKADGRATGWWWLRSPGSSSSSAPYVYRDGALGNNSSVNNSLVVVRPALWVDLGSGIF